MNFTNDQYQKLCSSIANGILTVKYSDKVVTYRTLSEIIKIKQLMEKDLGLNSSDPFNRIRTTSFDKGL